MLATWALGGLMLSVGGSLLEAVFGQTNHAAIGAVLGVFAASGAVAAVLATNLAPPRMTRIGTAALAVGTILFVVAHHVLVAAAVRGGLGRCRRRVRLGVPRRAARGDPLAEPHERAALLSAVYIVSYLAFSIPAVVAGLLITHVGLRDTALGYGGFVAVLALATLAGGTRRAAR